MKCKSAVQRIVLTGILAAVIIAVPASSADQGAGRSSAAADKDLHKEENVYALLNTDGSFKKAFVINGFTLDSPGTVTDHGLYDSVRNLSTTDRLRVNGDEISAEAPAGRFYYQGELENLELPWSIRITYRLDGKETDAAGLSGADGLLDIGISIDKNQEADSNHDMTKGGGSYFFKHYALQTTVTLDSEQCTAVTAENAAIANAGRNKAVTFTMLPGENADYTITAKVRDFHMDGIRFSAVPLSISLNVPDNRELTGELSQFTDGVKKLDNGAKSLKGGMNALDTGAAAFNKALEEIQSGADRMDAGLQKLTSMNSELMSGADGILNGLDGIAKGLDRFAAFSGDMSGLVNGSSEIKKGISGLDTGISRLKESIAAYEAQMSKGGAGAEQILKGNADAIEMLTGQNRELKAQLSALTDSGAETAGIKTRIAYNDRLILLLQSNSGIIDADRKFIGGLKEGINSVADGSAQLNRKYGEFDRGIQTVPEMLGSLPESLKALKEAVDSLNAGYVKLHGGLAAYLDGTSQIAANSAKLNAGYRELLQGYDELYHGLSKACTGANELAKGTAALKNGTGDMDAKIKEAVDQLMGSITGGDFTPVSFISSKNCNVESVQFVLQTDEIPEKAALPKVENGKVKLSFWKRFLALFGLK